MDGVDTEACSTDQEFVRLPLGQAQILSQITENSVYFVASLIIAPPLGGAVRIPRWAVRDFDCRCSRSFHGQLD